MATRFEKMVNAAKKNASEISPRKAAEAAEKGGALIIDVRDPDESQAAYVPNAKTISRGTLEIEIEELAPRYVDADHLLLWRWGSLCACGRKFAKNGLHQCEVDGGRL